MFRIGNYYKNLNKKRALENDNKSTKKIKIDLVTLRGDCLWYVDYEDKVALSVFKKLDKWCCETLTHYILWCKIPETFFAYKVRFSLKVAKKDSVDLGLYHDPSKFTLQLSRKQALAAKVNFKAEATIGVHSWQQN